MAVCAAVLFVGPNLPAALGVSTAPAAFATSLTPRAPRTATPPARPARPIRLGLLFLRDKVGEDPQVLVRRGVQERYRIFRPRPPPNLTCTRHLTHRLSAVLPFPCHVDGTRADKGEERTRFGGHRTRVRRVRLPPRHLHPHGFVGVAPDGDGRIAHERPVPGVLVVRLHERCWGRVRDVPAKGFRVKCYISLYSIGDREYHTWVSVFVTLEYHTCVSVPVLRRSVCRA